MTNHLLGLRDARLRRRMLQARRRDRPDMSDQGISGATLRGGVSATFRDLHMYCLGKMELWDNVNRGPNSRLLAQIKADPYYEPIGPWSPSATA